QQVTAGQVLVRLSSPQATSALAQAQQADAAAAASANVALPRVDASGLAAADAAAQQSFASAKAAAEQIPDATLRAQALAQIATAQAQYASARVAAQRAVANANSGIAGLEAVASSLAQTQRASTSAALAVAQATVDALVVKAPIAGTVVLGGVASGGGSSDVSSLVSQLPSSVQGQAQSLLGGSSSSSVTSGALTVGMPVSSGSTLLSVTDVSTMSLVATVDETDVLTVKPGIEADVSLDAVPDASYAGTVTSVDLAPTTSSRGGVSYVVRLSLGGGTTASGDPAPAPRPGMSAVASLRVLTAKAAVAVPAAAVFRDGDRDAVWVVENGVAHRRFVVLGAQGESQVQISSGLAVGERVVVKGADKVTEGQQVEGG
ncbi:MAG TPA: efflux RND transporter periplasmic adaptor subunit, partial [Actinomycetes bacterium]